MKKLLSLFLCICLLIPGFCKPAVVKAYPADAHQLNSDRATDALIMYVDYFDGKTPKYLKSVPIRYDKNGRLLDDGFDYHLYDRNGHEIMISNPMYEFPFFGDFHLFNNEEAKISYNEDGTPSSYSRVYRNLRFQYAGNGNIKRVEFVSGSNIEFVVSYKYSGSRIGKIIVDDQSGGAGGTTEYSFEYDGSRISRIHGDRKDKTGAYRKLTETVYSYDPQDRLKSVVYTMDGTVFESVSYSYDDKGRVTSAENYIYDKAEEGYMIFYHYEEGKAEPEPTDSETAKSGEVPIKYFFPESGTISDYSPGEININFYEDTFVQSINYDNAKISICDAETGEEVYAVGKGTGIPITSTILRFSDHWFYWKLPNPSSTNNPFQKGHTYYFQMEEGFLTFSEPGQKLTINDPKTWTFKVRGVPETKEYKFTWNHKGENRDSECRYTDSFFERSSYVYHPQLATMSLCMAMSAYNSPQWSKGYENIEKLLTDLGFHNVEHNIDYESKTSPTTTGVAFGSKDLEDGSSLIAVAVRGGAYQNEWAGNFMVGDSGDHEGFSIGKENVLTALNEYVARMRSQRNISEEVKIWIVGYSRGGAIANLTAAALDRGEDLGDVSYSSDDVYAYCFEAPNNTIDDKYNADLYRNLFTIRNPIDLVTKIPLEKWGFHIFGNVLTIPAYGVDQEFLEYKDEVYNSFRKLYQLIETIQTTNMLSVVEEVEKAIGRAVPSRKAYYLNHQKEFVQRLDGIADDAAILPNTIISVLFALSDQSETVELGKFIAFYKFDFAKMLFMQHEPTMTLSWVRALEGTDVLERSLPGRQVLPPGYKVRKKTTTKITAHCPVHILVFDKNGSKLAELSGKESQTDEDMMIPAFYGNDGSLNFYIPALSEVFLEIMPYDDGKMTLCIENFEFDSGDLLKTVVYPDLEVKKDQGLSMSVNTGFYGEDFIAELKSDAGIEVKASYELLPDAEEYYRVKLKITGKGTVYGGGKTVKGSYTNLYAIPENDLVVFSGWYDKNGALIASDKVLAYRGWEDTTLEARFSDNQEGTSDIEPINESTPFEEPEKEENRSFLIPLIVILLIVGSLAAFLGVLLILRKRKKRP